MRFIFNEAIITVPSESLAQARSFGETACSCPKARAKLNDRKKTTRRKFLQNLSGCLTTTSAVYLANLFASGSKELAQAKDQPAPQTSGKAAYSIAPWTGDDFTLGHQLRNRELPKFPTLVEREVDFVIVGGGIAGLTAAYYLRNHNVMLLEQYETLGGQSRGSNHKGLGFSYGADSISSIEGLTGELLSELRLNPLKLPPERNSWRWEKTWLNGIEGDHNKLYSEFKSLLSQCRQVPYVTDPMPARLDSAPFDEYLKNYSPAFIALIDAYLKSTNCAGASALSALAAMQQIDELAQPSYVFPGGNQIVTDALAREVSKSSRKRAFVWAVTFDNQKPAVIFTDEHGEVHKIGCRHVIVAVSPLVASRILHSIDDETRTRLLSFKYGSYLVANLILKQQCFSGSFHNWLAPPCTFSNISVAETAYLKNRTYKKDMGSILTIYQPYAPATEGRSLLLQGDSRRLTESIVDQLSALAESIEYQIESVVLSRWGHAIAVPSPGYFGKISKFNSTADSDYTLAHSSILGRQSTESAIKAARLAANRALRTKTTTPG